MLKLPDLVIFICIYEKKVVILQAENLGNGKSMETITIRYNPATVAAIKKMRSGKCKCYKSADEMFNDIL